MNKKILILIVSIIFLIFVPIAVLYLWLNREEAQKYAFDNCNLKTQQEASNNQSEHVTIEEVFWNEELKTCFVITRYPHLGAASDWPIEYQENNDIYVIEAETFSLFKIGTDKQYHQISSKTYFYKNLEEYLENPNKSQEWKNDFWETLSNIGEEASGLLTKSPPRHWNWTVRYKTTPPRGGVCHVFT